MNFDSSSRERLACAWFFGCIGLGYGIFTARLPALKIMTNASDGQIGLLLLSFGVAGFCGLLASSVIIERFGPKRIIGVASIFSTIALTIAGLALSFWQMTLFCFICGLGNGLCDVAMNAQGMAIERKYKVLCMSTMHACFSLGGVVGSLSGSLFAYLNLSPFLNLLLVACGYLLLWPCAYKNTASGAATRKKAQNTGRAPFFVCFLGIMSMLCYVSEGSTGEWGSVLLYTVKNASQQQAALVFACFSGAMVIGRFFGDSLRSRLGEVWIVMFGSLIGALAMCAVLLSSWPVLCLAAYALMGVGFAPIVPILYSAGGRIKGLSPGRASSVISVLAYSGLLFFPPFLGMLGDAIGLGNALWVIVGCCSLIFLGSFVLRRHI